MLFKMIYYLGNLLSSEDSSKDKGILIAFDRNFIKDKTFNGRMTPDSNGNAIISIILWDKHFPKTFFYRINSDKDELITLIKNESGTEKNFFKVCIDLKNEPIIYNESDYVNEKFEYFIFCKKENVNSIRKSYNYILIVDVLRPLYDKLLGMLCIYVYKIRRLQALAENEAELSKFFSNIWDAEMGLIEMINAIAKKLALIRIPSRNKLESKVSFDILEDKLQATLKLLLKTLEELYKKINKKDKLIMINETKISKIKDVILEFKGYIRRNMKKNQFSIICNEIIVSFKEFKVANSEIKNIKDTNTEIILECDSEKLKSFIDKYFNLLYKYCEVLENVDERCLTLYCFYISESGYPCEKILEEFYTDKLVAKKLKKYLLDFSEDMTDFTIFSQTDYFKNEFSARLLTNLDYLIEAYEQKDLFAKNLNVSYINLHLVDFYNIWSAILYDPYKETILTMEDLIKNMKDGQTELKVKVCSFLRKYLFIILLIILFGLTVLFIRLQRPSNFINFNYCYFLINEKKGYFFKKL